MEIYIDIPNICCFRKNKLYKVAHGAIASIIFGRENLYYYIALVDKLNIEDNLHERGHRLNISIPESIIETTELVILLVSVWICTENTLGRK